VTGAAWSISVEFTFYLVFPFLARFTLEQGARYLWQLLALMAFFKLAAFHVNDKSTLMYFSTLVGRFDQFLIGMLAALLVARHGAALQRHAFWLLPLAALLVICNSALQTRYGAFEPYTHKTFWIWWSMLEAAGWSAVIVAWVSFRRPLPRWIERTLDHGGKISFSFYLLHMAVLHLLSRTFGLPDFTGQHRWNVLIALVLTYGATWAISALSYNAIEAPFLRLRRSYGAKVTARGESTTGTVPTAETQRS
jgi:peptidoglycan/LPS O-acetylase OafA/YrhL